MFDLVWFSLMRRFTYNVPMLSGFRFLLNFTVPVLFFVVFQVAGTKPAITFAIGAALLQTLVLKFSQVRLSPFFIMAMGFTIFFGTIDLFLEKPRFFRLEPCVHNAVIATAFLVAVLLEFPLMERFSVALPAWIRPKPGEVDPDYLNKVSWAWIVYFFLKSGFYLYLGLTVDLGRLILLRSIVGTATLGMMFVGEWLIRRRRRKT